ncbi:hypothetical protein JHK85_016552 [Glycine max]|nr:hypothetical protein JHK85_016552 [Glycine max]KAG5046776.1 hypothetical protein JHK86_016182 [Glycine max]
MEDNALVSFLLCCSCSCLSHHWLPSTVAAYTHKRTLQKVDEHTKALILMSKRHFLCCSDVDALRLPSSSSVFSIIPICCGF